MYFLPMRELIIPLKLTKFAKFAGQDNLYMKQKIKSSILIFVIFRTHLDGRIHQGFLTIRTELSKL